MNPVNFMPTKKLYYSDAYLTNFSSDIVYIEHKQEDIYDIILDKTAFFPESGGQTCDRGILSGGTVIDVRIKNDVVIHSVKFTESNVPDLNVGMRVEGSVDFAHRFSNMQQHTAEHIFSGIVYKKYGYENVGFHLSDNSVTMDYSGPLSDQDVALIEKLTNDTIYKNLPVKAYFPDDKELSLMNYRSKLEVSEMGTVRIVSIDDIDTCACCAPHVSHTGEIGILKVIDRINHKGGTRISILCGYRALMDYGKKHDSLLDLSRRLSTPIGDINSGAEKLYEEISHYKELNLKLEEQLVKHAVSSAQKNCTPVIFTNINNSILLRNTANELLESGRSPIFIFNGTDSSGYNFFIASNKNPETKEDAVNILHLLSGDIEIKGGGKNPMVTGRCKSTSKEIETAVYSLLSRS